MRFASIAALALAAGCHRAPADANSSFPRTMASSGLAARGVVSPAGTGLPAAAETIRFYYERLGARDYAGAYRVWSRDGAASGTSEGAFAAGFAATKSTIVTVLGRGDAEGAAGSTYATIPVRVDALLTSGEVQHFAGSYVLRRINDVPGSSASERRWHIDSASLTPASQATKKGRG